MREAETPLQMAERHVREGAARIARQILLVTEMERDHPGQVAMARDILRNLQDSQKIGWDHLEQLRRKAMGK